MVPDRSKCELFWPSGGSFPEFPTGINRAGEGLELLGSPVWGTDDFFDQSVLGLSFSQG